MDYVPGGLGEGVGVGNHWSKSLQSQNSLSNKRNRYSIIEGNVRETMERVTDNKVGRESVDDIYMLGDTLDG